MNKDFCYMRHALNLARTGLGRTGVNPSVGCVLVKDEVVVAAARTADGGRPHAEFLALEMAGYEAKGATAYVTLEPCAHEGMTPSCARLLVEAGVARVVVGLGDPDVRTAGKGIGMLECGMLECGAEEVHRGFMLRLMERRPEVTLKAGVSVDGKIAAGVGERTQISGVLAQRYMHLERAQHDAILVGIETVLSDDPLLTCRLDGVDSSMVRVVLDSGLRLPVGSRLVQTASEHPLIVLHDIDPSQGALISDFEKRGVNLVRVPTQDISSVLKVLAERGINRLLVEGGARVHRSFLESGFVDQFLRVRSKELEIGAGGVDAIAGYDVFALDQAFDLVLSEVRDLGEDVLEAYRHSA